MKTHTRLFGLLSLTVVLCIGSTHADEVVLLQLNIPKGRIYKMTLSMTTDAEVGASRADITKEEMKAMAGQRFNYRVEETRTYDYEVKDVLNNGNHVMKATTRRIQMGQSQGNASMYYDTETKSGAEGMYPGMVEIIENKLNSIIELEFNQQGKLVRISPDDQYDLPIDQWILMFSSKKVKAGSTWTFDKEVKINGMSGKKKANILTTAKLVSIENGIANLAFEGIYKQQKGTTDFKLTGTQKGTAKVDTNTGLTTEIMIEQEVDVTETNSNGAEMPLKAKEKLILKIE